MSLHHAKSAEQPHTVRPVFVAHMIFAEFRRILLEIIEYCRVRMPHI